MSKPKSSKPPAEGAGQSPPADLLGERLRGMFTTLEGAPVPERIRSLVEALERKRRGRRDPRRN